MRIGSVQMHLKLLFWIGVLAYVVSFIAGIVISVLFNVDATTMDQVPAVVWYVSMVLTTLIGVIAAHRYFQLATPSTLHGMYVGVSFVIISFLFEFLLIMPLIVSSGIPNEMLAYYADPKLWMSIVLLILSTAVTGFIMSKKAQSIAN